MGLEEDGGGRDKHDSSFLDYRAFAGLAAGIPLVILLTSQVSERFPSAENFAGSALATGVCTLLVGGLLHLTINASFRRLSQAVGSPLLRYSALSTIGLVTVIASMMFLLPQLSWLCPAIDGRIGVLTMRAVGIAVAYIAVARVVAIMSFRAQQQTEIARQSEVRALHSRLDALKAQMNPHFLFNALNSVASLIPNEPKLAESTVEKLAGVLQYSLLSVQRERVSLSEELASIRDYLDIEEARFDGRLRTIIDVSPELYACEIPPMLLQPLVENAVLHGLAQAGSGAIKVTGRSEGDAMVLVVSDDGVGPGKSTRSGTRIGLGHIHERLALTYGTASHVVVREAEAGGFECELRIPVSP